MIIVHITTPVPLGRSRVHDTSRYLIVLHPPRNLSTAHRSGAATFYYCAPIVCDTPRYPIVVHPPRDLSAVHRSGELRYPTALRYRGYTSIIADYSRFQHIQQSM
jgi:hypothetical protein